jgi:crotonobetaine/carnitine-CoA ligase
MAFDDDGFVGLLADRAARDPDGIYARYEGEPVSYAALDRQARAFAAHLRRVGIRPGDRVAIMMRNSVAAIACVFGLAKAGVAWVPVNAQQRGDGLRYLLAHPQPRLVIADAELAALVIEALPVENAPPVMRHGQGGELEAVLAWGAGFDEPPPGGRCRLRDHVHLGHHRPAKGRHRFASHVEVGG